LTDIDNCELVRHYNAKLKKLDCSKGRTAYYHLTDLEGVLGVFDAVDPDVVVDGERYARREDGETEDLGGTRRESVGFAGQHEASQRVSHHVTLARVDLDVDGRVDGLMAESTHGLQQQRSINTVIDVYKYSNVFV